MDESKTVDDADVWRDPVLCAQLYDGAHMLARIQHRLAELTGLRFGTEWTIRTLLEWNSEERAKVAEKKGVTDLVAERLRKMPAAPVATPDPTMIAANIPIKIAKDRIDWITARIFGDITQEHYERVMSQALHRGLAALEAEARGAEPRPKR